MEEKESNLFNTVYREIGAELGLDAAIRVYQMFKGQQIILTEKDRRALCEKIAKVLYQSESLEAKKYLKEMITEIKVSNDDVVVTMNIA